jgi:hypothetical protein
LRCKVNGAHYQARNGGHLRQARGAVEVLLNVINDSAELRSRECRELSNRGLARRKDLSQQMDGHNVGQRLSEKRSAQTTRKDQPKRSCAPGALARLSAALYPIPPTTSRLYSRCRSCFTRLRSISSSFVKLMRLTCKPAGYLLHFARSIAASIVRSIWFCCGSVCMQFPLSRCGSSPSVPRFAILASCSRG